MNQPKRQPKFYALITTDKVAKRTPYFDSKEELVKHLKSIGVRSGFTVFPIYGELRGAREAQETIPAMGF